MTEVRVRYAPSPTGFAHIGNIRTAMYDWLLRMHYGGSFILRIEDTDRARIVPGALEEIMESLRWLGMQWDEGPEVGGPFGPYFQSQRLDLYHECSMKLINSGLAYYCFCTPERLNEMRQIKETAKESTGYDRHCLSFTDDEIQSNLANGIPYVIRFKVPDYGTTVFHDVVRGDISFDNSLLDDFVIIKSDGYPTYHFASVVDDHHMQITHVIRGEEWISSTPKHMLLYAAFGWDPPIWVHPPLILGPDKSKLSKRHGAMRFLEYRDKGFLPEAMINFLALLGWSSGDDQELFTVDELIQRFDVTGIVNHPVVFDMAKLEWMNGVYIRAASLERILELCIPFLKHAGLISSEPSPEEFEYIQAVISLVKDKLKTLAQVVDHTRFFFVEEIEYDEKGTKKWLMSDYVPELLRKVRKHLEDVEPFTVENIEEAVRLAGEEIGLSGGKVIHPIRMAVTGKTTGPGLFETMAVLGKDRVIKRLDRTIGEVSDIRVD